MYELVLTKAERDAIDWIGDRYATGNAFRELLEVCACVPCDDLRYAPNWEYAGDLRYYLEEPDAWEIRELFEQEEYRFPCFAPEFAAKLQQFADQIV